MTFELAPYAVPALVAVLGVLVLGLVLAAVAFADVVRERRAPAVAADVAPVRPRQQARGRLALHH